MVRHWMSCGVAAALIVVSGGCGLIGGPPTCGGANSQRSGLGPDGLPDSPVTWGDINAHPETRLVPPEATNIHPEWGHEECNEPLAGGGQPANEGTYFDLLEPSPNVMLFYSQ